MSKEPIPMKWSEMHRWQKLNGITTILFIVFVGVVFIFLGGYILSGFSIIYWLQNLQAILLIFLLGSIVWMLSQFTLIEIQEYEKKLKHRGVKE